LGVALALMVMRGTGPRKPSLAIAHGVLGATGLALLLIVLQGPRRGDAMGVGSFGIAAATLFGIALVLGPSIPFLLKRSPRVSGVVIAGHASLAITGFVLFLAWISIGRATP